MNCIMYKLAKQQTLAFITLPLLVFCCTPAVLAQKRPTNRTGSHSVRPRPTMSAADRSLVEEAMGVVCTEGKLDPKGSTPIDDMQARPSLPVQSSEALAGAQRAERLLPVAKDLVINALRQLVTDYGFQKSPAYATRLQRAIARVQTVKKVRP